MKDKEKQICVSTKKEVERRNKRDKEKDELSQALLHYATAEASGGIKTLIDCEGCAFYLYKMLGYRKIPGNSVVFSREEICELKCQAEEDFNKAYDLGSKETAEKFLQLAYDRCLEKSFIKKVEELAEQFGVEIKE